MVILTWDWSMFKGYFRTPCPLEDATHVRVTLLHDAEVLSTTSNPITLAFRRCTSSIGALLLPGAQGGSVGSRRVKFTDMLRTAAGLRFFMFECTRFVLAEGQLFEVKQTFGAAHSDFHGAAGGLSEHAAAAELDRCGPNVIPFEAESVLDAVVAECYNLPFVYQLAIYLNWFALCRAPPRPAASAPAGGTEAPVRARAAPH